MSFAALGVAGTIGVIAGLATVAGVSYSIYSSENPPKNPQQATQAITTNQQALEKLQTKLAAAQAAGKDTSKIQAGITKVQASITFLQNWIAQNGNTTARAAAAAQAVSGTPVASPVSGGAVAKQPGQKNWPLIIGGGAVAVGAGWAIYAVAKKRRKKK